MLRVTALSLLLVTTLSAAAPSPAPVEQPEPPNPVIQSPVGFIKGYTWGWNSVRGDYLGKPAEDSMKALAETGVNWTTIAYAAHLPVWNEPRLVYGEADPKMPSDDEIRRAIQLARKHRLKVCLKPVVNEGPDAPKGQWRGTIDFKTPDGKTDAAAWEIWWTAYDAYILHHARIAQETGCELFCIGCEMKSTERFTEHWRGLIRKVRDIYTGPLVYNAVLDKLWDIQWWDAVDILGISAYSWHPEQPDSSVEAQVAYWTKWRTGLRALAAKTGKPIFFIEIGCRSARGAAAMSGDFTHWEWPYDGEEQARFYEAAFRVFWNEPWFCGYSWWDWKVKLYKKDEADQNKEFVIYGKPAEQVLRTWYAKERK
ncbi:MAG: glycosyl hydrolase family 53 [Phycisphaerae bacterium]|nr:glycosyl hydrolase family 53 [Phycisphaerae bacterium]